MIVFGVLSDVCVSGEEEGPATRLARHLLCCERGTRPRARASTPARVWLCHYAEIQSLVEPGTGGLTPLTSKGPCDASAAVFRIRES